MKRTTQSVESLLSSLSHLETSWKDDVAVKTIEFLNRIPEKSELNKDEIIRLLDEDYETSITVFRLFLEMSKDEFTSRFKEEIGEAFRFGKTGYIANKELFVSKLDHFLLREKIVQTVNRSYTWKDIIEERLKSGRGSAIKGQKRGRDLEDFFENIVSSIFTEYDSRCSFRGKSGNTTEKADFAIPNKKDPHIVIEVKGYGATGSKQTDVIGDVTRIINEKRPDTVFLLFTDGNTWKERVSDFRKLVEFQNNGEIQKIYTKSMQDELKVDLAQLKIELGL